MRLERDQIVDDRYRLLGRLGSGGMADVWLAEDASLNRRIALKFLDQRFAQDQQFVERFRREATAAAGLQHPNVVGVYDRGEWEGLHYIAMEYVEGASLKELIARGLSVAEAVEILRQVLAGVGFAHERGIVHRDLKPQNVLVDRGGRARVADFGIARAGASEITRAGSVLGTAQYLSPEQAQGHAVTPASDLYSAGIVLYEALTGRLPFEGETPVAVALKQISERPRPPSELNSAVSPALDAVVLRALAKDPANRFASAGAFSRSLDAAEADPERAGLGDTATLPTAAAAAGAGALGAAAGAAAAEAAATGAGEARPTDPEAAALAEREAAAREEERGWRRWLHGWRLAALIIAALLLALGVVAVFALTRPDQVNVPRVVDRSETDARATLEERGFEVETLPRPACAETGSVIEQDPTAGAQTNEGSTVTLTVSTGQQVTIPPVRGLTAQGATRRLEAEQLVVNPPRERFNDRLRPGRALGTDPPGGTEVDCQAEVSLFVSKGANLVAVPGVVGLQQSQAEARLERRGFVVNVDTRDADEPEGQVIDQAPGAGSQVERGDRVTIVVSTGAGAVVVPDVVGQPREVALGTLSSRGVTNVRVVEQETEDESQDDRVIDQAPDGGTRIRSGDRVTVFVATFVPQPEPQPEPPTDEEFETP